jgi:hypothetical protein
LDDKYYPVSFGDYPPEWAPKSGEPICLIVGVSVGGQVRKILTEADKREICDRLAAIVRGWYPGILVRGEFIE